MSLIPYNLGRRHLTLDSTSGCSLHLPVLASYGRRLVCPYYRLLNHLPSREWRMFTQEREVLPIDYARVDTTIALIIFTWH